MNDAQHAESVANFVEPERPEFACAAAAYDDKGLVMFECDRLDTKSFWCVEDEVYLCPEHEHWARDWRSYRG